MRLGQAARLVVTVAVLALVPVSLPACGSRTNRFAGNGYEFRYPGDWKRLSTMTFAATAAAGGLSKEAVGVDDTNLAVVVTAHVSPPVTPETIGQIEGQMATAVKRVAEQGGGRVTAGPQQVTMGGLPALLFDLSGIRVGKAVVDSRLIFAFQGTLEFFLSCQHTPDRADQVEGACDEIMRSFRVTGPSP